MIRTVLAIVAMVVALGVVGEMDYADQCRAAKDCHYEGWAK